MEASVAATSEVAPTESAVARPVVKPYKHESTLFALSLGLSLVFWMALIFGTLGIALLWLLAIFIGYLFAQSAFIAYIRGTAVRLGPDQYPEIYERVRKCSEALKVYPVPEAYMINGDGLLNALATRFLGRDFLVLFSDVVDALERHPQALNFYIGHELGHIKRKHLSWGPVLWPASVMPLLGPAYSRACEYTCDAYGQACCEKVPMRRWVWRCWPPGRNSGRNWTSRRMRPSPPRRAASGCPSTSSSATTRGWSNEWNRSRRGP